MLEDHYGRENFKAWIAGLLEKINDLHLEVMETFQNAEGSRVASRWLLTGKNNGFAGTAPDQQDIRMTGTAVWGCARGWEVAEQPRRTRCAGTVSAAHPVDLNRSRYALGERPSWLTNTRRKVSALPNPASRAESATERPASSAERAASMRIVST